MIARIVMDIDDVISTHRNRDYENAIPNKAVIDKMIELSNKGVEFVLYTARGQISCNENLERIEREKGPTLRVWLKKHNVPHSELRFGKPIGDVYVDDAAMTPDEFINGNFDKLDGGSGKYIEQLGKFVIKESSNTNALAVNDWFDIAEKHGYNVPKVYARTYNKMRMEFINGRLGNTIPFESNSSLARDVAMIALSFGTIPGQYEFDVDYFNKYIESHIWDDTSLQCVSIAQNMMQAIRHKIVPTFCHGDLTMMNVIVKGNGRIYMIDPAPNKFSSYMLDLAKLRMSLNGYNTLFYRVDMKYDDASHLAVLDRLLISLNIYDVVRVLEYTCWVRLIKYRRENKEQYEKLINKLADLAMEVVLL